ncbi:hypothetical protein KKC08_04250 [Patescibacteria group bacterium]|nr:hypothetical protein [Patescibacteria group bacterium]MBU4430590.1 hypothetical protein [Patescibacteria group bacterium]MCG2702117.1 hypothetical protein [Candidatus Parcubacteria bacterium]
MPNLFFLSLTSLISYLFSISSLSRFTPQVIALLSAILLFISLYQKKLFINLISFIVNLIIFTTNGLNSPVFFLTYFLLFTIAFQNPPHITLSYSIILILLLSNSLNSNSSLLPLISLLFITPLSYLISKQHIESLKQEKKIILTDKQIGLNETNIFLWYSTIFKNNINSIQDSLSILLSQPTLPTSHTQLLKKIKKQLRFLLKSATKLTHEIDKQTD